MYIILNGTVTVGETNNSVIGQLSPIHSLATDFVCANKLCRPKYRYCVNFYLFRSQVVSGVYV